MLAAGAVDIAQKFSRFTEHWSPKIIAESNGWQFKLVKARGEFVWHQHEIDEVWRMSRIMADGEYTDFDDMIERTHRSVDAFVAGDPEPNKRLWSRSDDVALANPFGGSGGVGRVLKKCDAGREFCLGDVARVVGSDLAYVFEIQGFDAKLPGREMPLRVTRRRV